MAGDDAPVVDRLAGPHARVPHDVVEGLSAKGTGEVRAQRDDGDVLANAPDAQFLWFMGRDADAAGAMRREIVGLGVELSVGTGEEQLVGNEQVQGVHVGRELRVAELRLQAGDVRIGSLARAQQAAKDDAEKAVTTLGSMAMSIPEIYWRPARVRNTFGP